MAGGKYFNLVQVPSPDGSKDYFGPDGTVYICDVM